MPDNRPALTFCINMHRPASPPTRQVVEQHCPRHLLHLWSIGAQVVLKAGVVIANRADQLCLASSPLNFAAAVLNGMDLFLEFRLLLPKGSGVPADPGPIQDVSIQDD